MFWELKKLSKKNFKQENETISSSDESSETCSSEESKQSVKRQRTSFSCGQIFELETEFRRNNFINRAHRTRLCQQLSLPDQQIKIWFQSRRMKHKKDMLEDSQKHQDKKNKECEESEHREIVKRLLSYACLPSLRKIKIWSF